MMTKTEENKKYFDKLMFDLFITACEGGINYWAALDTYHWSLNPPSALDSNDDLAGFNAIVYDVEDPPHNREEAWTLDRDVMIRGYGLALTQEWRDKISWSIELPPYVVNEYSWDHDADDADIIVQLGLFGKVVYG